MPRISDEGRYDVTITEIEMMEVDFADDPNAFKLRFFGTTEDGFTGFADLIFSSKQFFNENTKAWESSAQKSQETLERCGIPDGNPQHLPAVNSGQLKMHAVFNAKNKATANGTFLNIYLNAPSRGIKLESSNVSDIADKFNKLMGNPAPPAPPPFPVEKPTPQETEPQKFETTDESIDDIPF